MSYEESGPPNEVLYKMSANDGTSDSSPPDAVMEDPVMPAQPHSSEIDHEISIGEGYSSFGRSDSESIRSRFSDSSSDGGQSPNRESVGVQAVSLPAPASINARESNTETTPSSMSWEELCNLDLGPIDDPDADLNLRNAIRLQGGGNGQLNLSKEMRLQQESNRGFDYDARPKSPFRWRGDDLQYQSVRAHLGQNPNSFDYRYEPLQYHANGRLSPLQNVRNVDDESPESPEDEWRWFVEQTGLVESSSAAGNEAPANAQDPNGEQLESVVSVDDPEHRATEEGDSADLGPTSDSALETPPRLHISTTSPSSQDDAAQAPPHEADHLVDDGGKDEPPTPPSAEELQMMTRMSPCTSLEKLHEMYEHLKASRFEDPAETLKFKRQLIEYERRRMKYNGLDDTLLEHVEYNADPSIVEMYTTMAAHIYRRQRDEIRVQADEQHEMRKEAERRRDEDGYEISMLKHELEVREEKLQRERKALAQKTRESSLWQNAYEKFAPIAKREFDRKERLKNEEDVIKDSETQTEAIRVQSAATQTTDAFQPADGKPYQEAYDELTLENETLELTISELNNDNRNLRTRNQQLEERIAASNETWQALADAGLDVSEGKQYFHDLRTENGRLHDELTRLKSLMENVKKWHEDREQTPKPTVPVSTIPPQQPAAGGVVASIAAAWDEEQDGPMPLILNPPQAWKDREAPYYNTEGFRRTRDAILRHFAREREKRRVEYEVEFERTWQEKLAEMQRC